MPSNTGYSAKAAVDAQLRSQFGAGAFPNGKYDARAALNTQMRKQFPDAFPGGQYSAQAAVRALMRDQFGDGVYPGGGGGGGPGDDPTPLPGGPPPTTIPPVEELPPEPTFFETGINFDPGVFGDDFNQFNGYGRAPGPFGPTFNRPGQPHQQPQADPGAITDPNEGRGYRIPGFGNPPPGPSAAPQTLFENTPPSRFGSGGLSAGGGGGGGGVAGNSSSKLRKFIRENPGQPAPGPTPVPTGDPVSGGSGASASRIKFNSDRTRRFG